MLCVCVHLFFVGVSYLASSISIPLCLPFFLKMSSCPYYFYCCCCCYLSSSSFTEKVTLLDLCLRHCWYCCKMMMVMMMMIGFSSWEWHQFGTSSHSSSNLKGHDSLIGLQLEISFVKCYHTDKNCLAMLFFLAFQIYSNRLISKMGDNRMSYVY